MGVRGRPEAPKPDALGRERWSQRQGGFALGVRRAAAKCPGAGRGFARGAKRLVAAGGRGSSPLWEATAWASQPIAGATALQAVRQGARPLAQRGVEATPAAR